MASSDGDATSSEATPTALLRPPSLEELSRRGVRALLLPWIMGLAASSSPSQAPREVVVLVNLRTGSITMIEGASDINAFMGSKDGPLPASKASMEAMPAVEVKEEGFECAICLTEFQVNGELAKEMPCKHRYHSDCIQKWLGIHGSCPICRYKMPAEEETENAKAGGNEEADSTGGEGRRDGGGFVFHIFVAGSGRSQSGSEMGSDTDTHAGRSENDTSNVNSGSGSAGEDDGSAWQDMDIDR